MPFHTYILYSAKKDRYYIGHTENINDRLSRHNNSGSKSTKHTDDWQLVFSKEFGTRAGAMAFEKHIKSRKSRQYIQSLISPAG